MERQRRTRTKRAKRIAINIGGADAPGLNAVIRAVAESADELGHEVFGIRHGYAGLIDKKGVIKLTPQDVAGITSLGGAILGTGCRGCTLHPTARLTAGQMVQRERERPIAETREEAAEGALPPQGNIWDGCGMRERVAPPSTLVKVIYPLGGAKRTCFDSRWRIPD